MKYLFTLLVSGLFFFFQPFMSESLAQQHVKTGTVLTATSTSFALGNSGALHTQLLYNSTDLSPVPNGGNITKLWFKRAVATNVTLTNFSIKLGQTSATSGFTTGASFNTGLSTVFSTTGWTSPAGAVNAWFSIDINSFSYDPALQLIVDLSFTATSNESFAIASTLTSGTTQNKLYAANNTSLTGTTSTNWADIGLSFAAPSNDNCASSTLLSPSRNCAKTTTGTTMGATASFTTTNCAGFLSTSSDDEVWYSFVAEGTGDTVTVTGIGSFDPVIEAFASCGSVAAPTRIACSDATTTGGSETLIFPTGSLTAGNTYRVRVFSFDSYRGNFNICLRNKNAISNDDCSNPIALTGRTSCQPISATTAGATQSLPASVCGGFLSSAVNDVWFSFTAFNPTDSILVNGQGALDAVVQILDECSLNGYSRCTDIGGTGLEILSPGDLIPGKKYFVRVYGWNGADGTFSICHKYFGRPSNDDCSSPVQLQVGPTCSFISRNTFNATMDDTYSDCSGLGDDDVWFTFTAPSSQAEINVTQTLVTSTAFFTFNPVIEVYSNCNPASFINCVNTAPTNGTSLETMNLTGLNPGQTYYIRVYHAGSGSGNVGFNICVVNTFCDPQVGTAKIISPLTSDVLSNGSVQLGVTGHSGILVWEYSTDGISFTPDPSLTTDIATFIPKTTFDTKYYFRAKVTDGFCSPKYSDTVSINVRCHSPISFTSLSDGTYISNVSLSDLDRTSTFDPLGGAYQDFRKDTAHLCLGGTRIIFGRLKLTISSSVNSYQRMVWVDLNRNGSFGDPGEILHSGSSLASATTNINLVFPSSIEEGVYPMRIAIYSGAFGNGNPDNPCASNLSIPFGEIEEYTLRIYRNPTVNAGQDLEVCVPSVQLNALYPGASHTGTWTVRTGTGLTGEGLIANPHDTNSVVTNLKPGINSFIWTVTGPCGTFSDTVDVNFILLSANAGTDQVVCTTMVFLNATPPAIGSGFWSVLQGNGSFTNQQSATSLVFGPAIGINRYVWTVTGGNCPSVSDTVTIDVKQNPTFANAGNNQSVCGSTSAILSANTPIVGTGKWTVIAGSGIFVNDSDPNTTVTNLGNGFNSFRWTISNTPCFPSFDDVNVIQLNPVIANAGIDQTICQDTALLVGNDPNDEGISTSWTQIAGSGSIFNGQSFQTQVAGLATGINRFVYSIFEPGCPVSRDTVDVDRKIQPGRATTGADQTICSSSTTIAGNIPSAGTGKWTRISGQGTIQNSSSNSTLVTNLGVGANVFRWTISNPPCADRFAEITIFRNTPIPAQAGTDQVICTTFVQLNGIDPAIDGVGTSWTQIAGTSSTFNSNTATPTFFSLTAGLNRYVYSVTVPGCPASTDTVDVVRKLPPTTANAGNNQTVCSSNATLAGNTATSGTGKWTRISGAGNISNDANPTSAVTGLGLGSNVFRWTISNPPCADSFDEVTIFRTSPIIANAGTDQVICSTFVQLSGNVIVGNSGTSTWTQVQGTGLIGSPNSAVTTVNNLSGGLNRFVYSITTPSCPNPSTDTVDVIRSADPTTANAGNNQTVCSSNATLAGNTATSGTGKWTRISGAGNIGNDANPTSAVTGLGLGSNVFRWTISNPPCADSFDEVTIFRTSPIIANAGTDQVICTTFVQLSGNVIVGNSGTSTWTQVQGTGLIGSPNSAVTTVNNLSAGLNRFVYSITTPSCPNPSTDTVRILVNTAETAQAGPDQVIFTASSNLAANNPTGIWTRISGSGTVANPTNPASPVSGLGLGNNVFVWTFNVSPCPLSTDTVVITRNSSPNVCQNVSITAQHLGGADAEITLNTPINVAFINYKISFGDAKFTSGDGGEFTGNHTYSNPGIFNVCARVYYMNVLNRLDSCDVCDTVQIPVPVSPCSNPVVTASHTSGLQASIDLNSSVGIFNHFRVDFGDGTTTNGTGSGAVLLHSYPGAGTYRVCGRFYFTDAFQRSDSCEKCDTVNIPVPFNPCDDFHITNLSTTKTDITEPLSMRGYLYELSDSVSFAAGSFQKVTMRVFDDLTNENQLEGSLIPGTGASFLSFNLTIPPGQKRICYTGYFGRGNGLDSCTVCYLKNLPAPDFCEFFDLKIRQVCRNTVEWKEIFSAQAPPDSVLIDFGDGQTYQTILNGDSGVHTYSGPGLYKICAYGMRPAGTNFIPTDSDCIVCRNVVVDAQPDAGPDQTICLNTYSQTGSAIPTGYQAKWELVSGSATLDNSVPENLAATGLSAGSNTFRYVFYTATQSCPEEADTLEVIRVLPVVANAGTDQSTFLSSTNLAAGNPTGFWSKIAGSGSITNPSDPGSGLTGFGLGDNVFVWSVSQSPCPLSTDTVVITRNAVPNVCQGISLVAQSTGGATGSIVLTSPTSSTFISNQISFGDGIVNSKNGGNFTGTHAYPAPGLYKVCAKLFYVNSFQQLDSCEICDTIRIPEIVRPCSSLNINASHFGGMNAGVDLFSLNPSFTMHVVSFGDGALSPVGIGATGIYSHTYDAPGIYNVCAKVYFNDAFQRKDSCEICDTVNIPEPFHPCDSFKVTRVSTIKTDIFEPESMRGYLYSLNDSVSFVAGSINKVTMRVFDAVTNENQLEGSLIPGSGATFSSFNLTIPPGKKRVCYTGYFVNGQVPDSCTICYTDSLPFPPVCDFFSIDVKPICRNTAQFKVHYSGQSGFDSVWVLVNDVPVVRIPSSGDSVNYTFATPGKYKICAIGLKESLDVLRNGPFALDLPGPACRICDSLDIAPGPDAGLDDTTCASVYDRNGFGIPDGYLADWSVASGGATLDLTEPFNLRASNLSIGENKFVFRFLKADQSCPSETDTMSIFRVLPLLADAGTDQSVNASSAVLAAGNPTGTWTVLSGGASVSNPTNPGSEVTSLSMGANMFVWTVTTNPCEPSTDTVVITRVDACASVSLIATHTKGFFAKIKPQWPATGPFFSGKVKFGDGTESAEMTSPDSLTHLFSGPGIYTVCGRFLYTNTAQQTDSCVICDTVTIPEFVSPCDSFKVDFWVGKTVVDVNPEETQGWYYDYAVDLSNTSRFSTTKFRFDDGPLLDVANYGIANTAFSYIQTPSDSLRKLCVIGYYEGPDGNTDSCMVCQEFSNPFPPVCDFLTVNLAPVCRNTADVKVQFSEQSRFDSVWVSINEGSLIHIPASGDSIRLTFPNPGKYRVCAVANGAAGRPQNLDLPGFTCAVCDSLNVLAAPDAGNDTTICGSDFFRNGKEVPSGYTGGWLVTQGTASVSGFSENNLSATNLSPGLNQFVYRFFSQTCATETDTVNVFRETGDLADAGPDQTVCADSTHLVANLPSGSHTGHWTVVQGTGTFDDANSPVTKVSGLSVGLNIFRWIIINGVCPADSNEVEINRLVPSVANAGLDKTVCRDSTFLQATGTSGSGFWTLVSGNGVLSDNQDPQSTVSHLNVGSNTFLWTTISQNCPVDTDQVIITFAPPIHAFGGFDDTVYVNLDTLKGNDPGIGTSKWNKISGASQVLTPFNPVTVVTDLSPGLNEFVYTVRNPICQTEDKAANADSVTSDTVRIYYFIPVQSNAGRDTSICSSTPFQLYGNLPGQGTGLWTLLEGSGTIDNPADPASGFSNPGSGTNRLIWSVTTPGLDASTDTITVQVSLPASQANAGADKVICETFMNMEGNTPSIGTGTWTVLAGTGTLSNVNEPSAGISNLSFGLNQLIWTISNGVCPSTTDSVYIVVSPPLDSDAGIDRTTCGDTITLHGSPVPFGAAGEWKVAAGAGTFSNPNASTTLVTGLAAGVNTFNWVLTNGVCRADSDFVAITSLTLPSVAVAGDDQAVCGSTGTLTAQPAVTGTGSWSVVAGSAIIEFPDQFNSPFTGLGIGTNQLVWTISNAPCASTSDTVFITGSEMPVANAGQNANACGDTATLEATVSVGQSGTWTSILGTGTITNPTSASSTVSGITTKINRFVWTIVSGACTATDTITITSQFNPLAFGPDKVICEDSILILDAGSGFSSYLWNEGSATQTISVDTAGTFSVTIQTSQGCTFSDTVTVIETICTDVDPLLTSKLNWSLYPNPSQGKLMMRLDNAIPGTARLKVYSNLGVLVFEDPAFGISDGIETQVQLPTLPDGVYYLELTGTGYRLKEKLVIRK